MSKLIFICISCGKEIYPENVTINSDYSEPNIAPDIDVYTDNYAHTYVDDDDLSDLNQRSHTTCYNCMQLGYDHDQNQYDASIFNAEPTDDALSNQIPVDSYYVEDFDHENPYTVAQPSYFTYDKISNHEDIMDDGSYPPPFEN